MLARTRMSGDRIVSALELNQQSQPDASAPRALRILMIAPQPFFRARGTPFSILHRVRALLVAGHRVDLITYPFGNDVELPGLRIVRCRRPPFVRDVRIGPSLGKLLLDVPLYTETARMLRKHAYDVLHSHEEAAFFAMRLARRHGVRHVYDMHSSLPQQLRNFSAYNLAPVRAVFEWLERRVLERCDGVITICPELAEIAARYCGGRPHEMIENTADDKAVFGRHGADPRDTYGLAGKQVILYTGTFEPYQGLDLLLQAFASLSSAYREAHLLMVGGTPAQVQHYKSQARGLADAVTFVGSVHPGQIPAFLDAADLIVSPRSRGTNTPLKIYGYMRSQRPIVATDLPTHTQVLDSEVARLVAPTADGIAAGLRAILDNPAYGVRLAQAAAARAEQRFSDAAYLERVEAFYRRVLCAGPSTPAPHLVSFSA